jgi:hypothetical protein
MHEADATALAGRLRLATTEMERVLVGERPHIIVPCQSGRQGSGRPAKTTLEQREAIDARYTKKRASVR